MPDTTTIAIDANDRRSLASRSTRARAARCSRAIANPTPLAAAADLTRRQAAELARISARHGHTTWHRRADGSLLVCVRGDWPTACDALLLLVMRADGTIAFAARPAPYGPPQDP